MLQVEDVGFPEILLKSKKGHDAGTFLAVQSFLCYPQPVVHHCLADRCLKTRGTFLPGSGQLLVICTLESLVIKSIYFQRRISSRRPAGFPIFGPCSKGHLTIIGQLETLTKVPLSSKKACVLQTKDVLSLSGKGLGKNAQPSYCNEALLMCSEA